MQINVLLIGIWPHSRRTYIPLLNGHKDTYNISLCWIIDLASKREEIQDYLEKEKVECEKVFFDPQDFIISDWQKELNNLQLEQLTSLVKKYKINAVIIATEPLSHKTYALRALDNWLHIIMDKPVSTRFNIVKDKQSGLWLIEDFNEILEKYSNALKSNSLVFMCMSQRRYQWAYNQILNSIKSVGKSKGIPVTSIFMQHTDGQRRFPNEIIDEIYHGYNEGYGKCSHSWYHFFDMLSMIIKASIVSSGKTIDNIDVYSDFTYPKDIIDQFTITDYQKNFPKEGSQLKSQEYYEEEFSKKVYGEVDANVSFTLKRWNKKITTIQLSLLHNSLSERTWFAPKNDLYKWNGRVRHETVLIQQGPMQALQYQGYHLSERSNQTEYNPSKVWWEHHSELYVYENTGMTGGAENLKRYDYSNVESSSLKGFSKWLQEKSREMCFLEFLDAVSGNIPLEKVTSSIADYDLTVALMGYTYASAAEQSVLNFPLSME